MARQAVKGLDIDPQMPPGCADGLGLAAGCHHIFWRLAGGARGRHDGRQIMKHAPAQFLGPDCQASALIVIEMQPLASQLLSQHAVLFLKIVDDILLPLVQPACKGNQKQAKGIKCRAQAPLLTPPELDKGARN